MKTFNGHRSWASCNVYLWLSQDEFFYGEALNALKRAEIKRAASKSLFVKRKSLGRLAAQDLLRVLPPKTPDGARFSLLAIGLALDLIAQGVEEGKKTGS